MNIIKLILILMCSVPFMIQAQSKTFHGTDAKLKVAKGDVVTIEAETAYIISQEQAGALNQKLDELVAAGEINQQLKLVNAELLTKVKEVEELVGKLLKQMKKDSQATEMDLQEVLVQLDNGLATLRENNQQLEDNNSQLQSKIDAMDGIIKKLKKEIRGIWWNGIVDKIVVGAGGLAVGVLIMVL